MSDHRTQERRKVDLGPPRGMRERRHISPSGRRATDAIKMSCPHCGASESSVVRVRGLIETDAIRRRRECATCGKRFPTKETVDRECLEMEQQSAPTTPGPSSAAA